MANNKTKIDSLHDLLPQHFNTKTNVNWNGLLEAIGQADQDTANLIAEVRKQFFIKTANRPYLDRLAANNKISRPRLVGMSDTSFRDYIPVLSYKPKQVKLIIDALLDIFFFKEATTAFIMSQTAQPFSLSDTWELTYTVDGIHDEKITFLNSDFTNINSASADEVVAALNRQTKYSYATNYYDSITKKNFIRIFSKTIGSKGSIQIDGGRANIALKLSGFILDAGNGSNTQWTISKIGDITTFQHTGGTSPSIDKLQVGDIIISDITNNKGSFAIKEIDLSNNLIRFNNLFSTPCTYTQISANQTKFIRPNKYVAYKAERRAITWETSSGEIVVEMPTTPPVVQRSLKGSMHINGVFSMMSNRGSDTSLDVIDATGFPKSGSFIIEPVDSITSRILTLDEDEITNSTMNGRLISNLQKYTYNSRIVLSTTGNTVAGSNQVFVNSVSGLENGMSIFIEGLRQDAVITNISGQVVTSSVSLQNTMSNVTVEFGNNTLTGINPSLPSLGSTNQKTISSIGRSGNIVTAVTSNHNYNIGDTVIVSGSSGINSISINGDTTIGSATITNITSMVGVSPGQLVLANSLPENTKIVAILGPSSVSVDKAAISTENGASIDLNEDLNGSFIVKAITSTSFDYDLLGKDGTASVAGSARTERIAISNSGSKIIITGAQSSDDTRIKGPYIWDTSAPYVLSSATANIQSNIKAGTTVRLLDISTNQIPSEAGFIIFDYGRTNQEGPIRYLYKPAENTIALDPSYVFQKNHDLDSSIVALSQKGPHQMDGRADEYAPYITDPSEAREILKGLIRSVKSAGIFVNFLIRFPEQLYGVFDVYNQQGNGAGQPFN